MISKSLEEYLKTIYVLKKQTDEVRVTDIALKMNCTKPSVNKALHNLKDNGYINYEAYGEIELTKAGEEHAKKILEAYDIVYLFLKEVLNLEATKARSEADKMKLSMSDETLNELKKYVHKVLDLSDLNCAYNLNNELCRRCPKATSVSKIIG